MDIPMWNVIKAIGSEQEQGVHESNLGEKTGCLDNYGLAETLKQKEGEIIEIHNNFYFLTPNVQQMHSKLITLENCLSEELNITHIDFHIESLDEVIVNVPFDLSSKFERLASAVIDQKNFRDRGTSWFGEKKRYLYTINPNDIHD